MRNVNTPENMISEKKCAPPANRINRDRRRRYHRRDQVGEKVAQIARNKAVLKWKHAIRFVKEYAGDRDIELRPDREHHADNSTDRERDDKARPIHASGLAERAHEG